MHAYIFRMKVVLPELNCLNAIASGISSCGRSPVAESSASLTVRITIQFSFSPVFTTV